MPKLKSLPRRQTSEIRKAYLLDKYVIITPGRTARPRDIQEQTVVTRTQECPFCPENIIQKNIVDRLGDKNDWRVLSVKNTFPAVTTDNRKAYGVQEVIIETPNHKQELADLSEGKIREVLAMYARRNRKLAADKKLNYVLCFKNQGSKAGASIVHAHSQIFATAIIPPEVHEETVRAENYRVEHNACPYCAIIKKEIKSGRKIFADKYTAAFAPYASEYHYEAWIFPRRHLDNISLLSAEELKSFARVLKIILMKLRTLNLSFNYFLHNVVADKDQHFYLKIQPRDSIWAGIELGSGLVINSIPPETAARYYRQKNK